MPHFHLCTARRDSDTIAATVHELSIIYTNLLEYQSLSIRHSLNERQNMQIHAPTHTDSVLALHPTHVTICSGYGTHTQNVKRNKSIEFAGREFQHRLNAVECMK